MILGTGIDIIELKRIKRLLEKNDRFLERVLTKAEQEKAIDLPVHRRVEYAAGRFAAKEAFAKANGTGIGKIGFQQMEIKNNLNGAPEMQVEGMDDIQIHLSISHSREHAVAQVLLEKR
ncbi:holo-ACP synthase [Oceanobacillus neutriphilus]|uniref:Holo-[acyl-carrier-protein] synthase n=1 Tax=Oceanobacillus neutriphilus TaxID=531815 RepID=A0ABQ2NZY7_9BACI|nr:holo-ACP synthase [Oceanobacillus neutriphilus]GGP14789.1 holo-[acyl-carrier-protein] synthase [Oceanobacillus neutriphilus]